ncbi:MAG: hypothetical protein J1F18_07565 [Lachnospiraceae bacterium]|nr:hypothetical protein [Lachnospiraceae bacterium]
MKKKLICAILTAVLIIASIASLAACSEVIDYDAGEYGRLEREGSDYVVANAGYRFIGWSEPVQKGRKTVYKAQYEYAEYYLSEVKDTYICPQDTQEGLPYIKRKITNMQTMEERDDFAPMAYTKISCSDERCEYGWFGDGKLNVNKRSYEFDGILTIAVKDNEYNIEQEINIHVVRNRIKPESLTIYPFYGEYTVAVGGYCYIGRTYLPENTTFTECGFNIVEIIRDGEAIDAEKINEIAYFEEGRYEFTTTDKAQVGDIIKVQAYNLRDPDIISNILSIIVY